ncbi:SPFH domain / Band 7 family protein [Phycisphaerae bacterium RAS1]|nr:SPFH domain / Band 7 family protein [Phycisphaerae bacterium RAS1]
MKLTQLIKITLGSLLILTAGGLAFVWGVCRVTVPSDQCLVLIRKTGAPLPAGETIAGPGQKGIQRETYGPGRYFFNPWRYDSELHDLVEVPVGDAAKWREHFDEAASDVAFPKVEGDYPKIGILVNKVGKPAPAGAEVVDEGFRGIQKQVLTPGVYRINPHVYEVRLAPATVVPLGFCGVVTSQLGDMPDVETIADMSVGPDGQSIAGQPKVIQKLANEGQRGVRREVLQPGIYYLNPYVYRVSLVQVGYNQIAQLKTQEAETHISFPSKDGFTISVEVVVVWGRHPSHTAEMLNRFGDLDKLKQIILSQMRSICRNTGSDYESTDFIRGEKRELYQQEVTRTLQRVCADRDIDILIALIQNIEVRAATAVAGGELDLRQTIQRGFIAREQDLTKQTQRETAKVRADLETAKVLVDVARETITAETRKKVAEVMAEGQKQAQEIEAQRDLEVATIERQIAELDAERTRITGKATTTVEQLKNQANADGRRMMVEALGSGEAYNLYTFAQGFSPDSVRLIFAGEGTFWTDLNRLQDAAALEVLRKEKE